MGTFVKKTADSEMSTHKIPIVVSMLTAAHNNRSPSMIFSFGLIPGWPAVANDYKLQAKKMQSNSHLLRCW